MVDEPTVSEEIEQLVVDFFRAVTFAPGEIPSYEAIRSVFIERGLLIKNSGPAPEISTVTEFIEPRRALVASGDLSRFLEREISNTTEVFGNVAHRFSIYEKSGVLKGRPFESRGKISTQFVRTPAGWRMSAMAWDDERPDCRSVSDRAVV